MHDFFNQLVNRSDSDSAKWSYYEDDVLPMWVADMDFRSPEAVIQALHERIDHGAFGYCMPSEELTTLIRQRMERLYGWSVASDEVSFIPGLVSGLNVVSRAFGEAGDGVLVNEPVYPPFLSAPENQGHVTQMASLVPSFVEDGAQSHLRYDIDFEALEAAIDDRTRLFLLCNPHNPIGRAYTPDELERIAEICTRHDLIICSDEIHSDLLLGGTKHTPIASLSPEIAERTITLLAPSKTFNLPGLGCSIMVTQNPELRTALDNASRGIVPHVNIMGYVAATAAYAKGGEWLETLLAHLTANRDFLVEYVNEHMPQIRVTKPEATYLTWLDCRETGIEGNPYKFFLEKAKVGLNDGANFGPGGEGFVRLNFGCPRPLLEEGLQRMSAALENVAVHA